ncbi:PREDICTED: tigger transposable element-derived protein 2-like [Habropoda laboriosa]|uniref:tigger transposable element-derived protein 2-like n=1 Tax=Habropoda laboriosa TaxID=597456 RepID=UPI00083D91D0|nr:PREDICTED: tigger transposable element-derived protein 2-like [Habropoda laboriosa]
MYEKKRRKIVEPVYDELGKHLLAWFAERRTLSDRVTDALMLKKARELKENLPSCSRFKVSRGWLSKFKKRHGIRLACKEKASADQDVANTFIDDFKKLIQEKNINLENIYNMDESGLLWKALPTKTLAEDEARNISGYKLRKDRITIGLCTNALGTHKIMPLVIYKYKSPRALKHEVSLPVIFKSQMNAWMDRTLFLDWFENHFKPSVQEYQDQKQTFGKVFLLLDNCESHKVSSAVQEDEHFKIIYLPPNATFIQPMDQGIIEETKKIFRHKMLQRVLTYDNGVIEFYKDYTLKNCIDILSKSWLEITQSNIRNAWNKIIGPVTPSNDVKCKTEIQLDWEDMISVITGEECTQQHVTEFLSVCGEAERKHEEEQIKEETVSEEEPPEEPHEIIYQEHNNEIVRNELLNRGLKRNNKQSLKIHTVFDKIKNFNKL